MTALRVLIALAQALASGAPRRHSETLRSRPSFEAWRGLTQSVA